MGKVGSFSKYLNHLLIYEHFSSFHGRIPIAAFEWTLELDRGPCYSNPLSKANGYNAGIFGRFKDYATRENCVLYLKRLSSQD